MNGVDRVTMEMDEAMNALKRSMRGIPVAAFASSHKVLARAVATLHTEMRWARHAAVDAR
ncbi:hypothetical protein [Kutzneria kofuensis]|uniref:Uncharacterized protein n=1 Tax=Kutzneria kofuensis TaxID=103725 RepID=A0A7W9KDM1_9PSEU|nr:hypothetical protein [Kutzneria kofuensis]MBB5890668.1 hypothetical protein [Kutzneria kofuensis]